ncbi:hypothetical protein BaRGS_00001012 [Batillaria attramentaria]|uniref:Uncharacterized protein n=1 Tax=Batillaria attramentaria TaxID=370345 RepID=A0ABD0M9I8_9CAEN
MFTFVSPESDCAPQSQQISGTFSYLNEFFAIPDLFKEKGFLHQARLPHSISKMWSNDFYKTSDTPVHFAPPSVM